jgi:hypothetical protein
MKQIYYKVNFISDIIVILKDALNKEFIDQKEYDGWFNDIGEIRSGWKDIIYTNLKNKTVYIKIISQDKESYIEINSNITDFITVSDIMNDNNKNISIKLDKLFEKAEKINNNENLYS